MSNKAIAGIICATLFVVIGALLFPGIIENAITGVAK